MIWFIEAPHKLEFRASAGVVYELMISQVDDKNYCRLELVRSGIEMI